MSSHGAFEPLVALAKARTVALVEAGELPREDGEFLLRALIDLETDGAGLFAEAADGALYDQLAAYLAARVGRLAADAGVLAPASAETIAALRDAEGARVAELLALPGFGPPARKLDRAVVDLVTHKEVHS